ncbi:MAG TPA: response regulator [Stellaceae bacterium]|nr:response regulator [Stellaceae bacterium]
MEKIASTSLKILIVEDDCLVAEIIADALSDHGYTVVGPAPTLNKGLLLAREADLDGALLDVNLGGCACFPIAEVLRERRVPFMFVTGCIDPAAIPAPLRMVPRLAKPFKLSCLGVVVGEAFGHPSAD